MTREEAIKKIKSLCHDCVEFPHCVNTDPDCFKALEIAIEALEQDSCEDCISREEVCDYIAEFVNHEYATDREREMVKHIIGGIQHLPSIQPTTKENLVVGDCISRQAVLDLVEDMTDQFGVEHRVITEGVISMLPPVTPKPMQVDLEGDGYSDGKLVYDYGKCPKCGWQFEYGEKDWEEPYCCHCGQRLKWFESEDEE